MKIQKVMIVDDDKEFLEELGETLALSGYDMVAVGDPVSALEMASEARPQLILLDLKMPGMSGFQLADEIRRFSQFEHIPILAMSAYFKDEYASLMDACGIKKCLKKPFNPLDVISEIEKSLQ
jgi:CheY-like chemotaxis protein